MLHPVPCERIVHRRRLHNRKNRYFQAMLPTRRSDIPFDQEPDSPLLYQLFKPSIDPVPARAATVLPRTARSVLHP
jgi:hypothetical protein